MAEPPITNSRADVLALLAGQRSRRVPCFSGLISLTTPGLEAAGLRLPDAHHDPERMAAAAASTYRLCGFESAVVPFDLCVEAELLGGEVDFRADEIRPAFPRMREAVAESAAGYAPRLPADWAQHGRLPTITAALALLKEQVGGEIVVGAWVPGPMTLAMQLVDINTLVPDVAAEPEAVRGLLERLADVLAEVARLYRASGADFITVHEMGGSPGYVGPRSFERVVLPPLQRLLRALPAPRVLSVCGRTNRAMALLASAGADALSVDQTNDLAASRAVLGVDPLLFGNLDPVATLAEGDAAGVRAAVAAAIQAGADAIWPGCDLWPPVPVENMKAMVEAAARGRRVTW
jgi:[methyl-Co(III) methanol-specific corrinoid protein]:coenzyme M methyltransferase